MSATIPASSKCIWDDDVLLCCHARAGEHPAGWNWRCIPGQSGEWRTAGFACHCEEQGDAAVSVQVPNWPEIASPRLREGRNDNEIQADTSPSPVHPIALRCIPGFPLARE